MSEFSELGRHCSYQNCNLKDFLPLTCKYCSNVYCKEHSSLVIHECQKLTHNKSQVLSHLDPIQTYKCSFNSCKTKELIEFKCEFCVKSFCCQHRLQLDHKCIALSKYLPDKNAQPKREEFNFEVNKKVSDKNTSLQSKLILMKMKQTAQGPQGLPEECRFYAFVHWFNTKKPFYLSIDWPIGKCIEFLATKCNISSSNGLKLSLNSTYTDPIDTSLMLKQLIKLKCLTHGSDLFLFK